MFDWLEKKITEHKYKTTERFAKRWTETLLDTLYRVQERYPELNGKNLYKQVVILVQGYDTHEKMENIIKQAEESLKRNSYLKPNQTEINFRDVVFTLLIKEYCEIVTIPPSDGKIDPGPLHILTIVDNIIPPEL
jgi:hypothetical protein